MVNFENLYEDNSSDLVLATVYKIGKTYITENGTRVRYQGEEDGMLSFKIVTKSPLEDGARISDFEKPNALELFWRLSNKEYESIRYTS